jgi:hypothetical protein
MARTYPKNERQWTNWHLSLQHVPIAERFEIANTGTKSLARMAETAAEIQKLIERAFAERRRLRAVGGAWSYSEAPSNPGGWLLSTGYMNWKFPLTAADLHPSVEGHPQRFLLVQTGAKVSDVNEWFEPSGWSLPNTGASNGQTFVGAMSTGTHGSAIDSPAIEGAVRAIHLLPAPDVSLWIEPESRPVTNGAPAAAIGATVVRSDRLFEAVLVGLGAFGVIQAVLLEGVPRFLLLANRLKHPITPGLEAAMRGKDYAGLEGPHAPERPWFFQSVLNRHIDRDHAYVTIMHKRPWRQGYPLDHSVDRKRGPGWSLAAVVADLLEALPGITKPITKLVVQQQLGPLTDREGSLGETFNFTTARAGTAGASVAVAAADVLDALDLMTAALASVPKAPVAFACRYALKSPALIGFTRFDRTAIIDIDGLETPATRRAMAACIAALRSAGIPHAEHWGKLNQLTAASVRDSYGPALEAWMKARTDLLSREGEYVFGSDFLDRLGMTSPAY